MSNEQERPRRIVDPIFKVHMLNDVGRRKAQNIAERFDVLLETLKNDCDFASREFSIVKTKLEEACFFAKKSMANVPTNQKADEDR